MQKGPGSWKGKFAVLHLGVRHTKGPFPAETLELSLLVFLPYWYSFRCAYIFISDLVRPYAPCVSVFVICLSVFSSGV